MTESYLNNRKRNEFMVFEDLIGPIGAKRHPLKLFGIGIFFSFVASAFSLWIFKQEASLVMVFLVVLMTMPLMYFTLREEEEEDWTIDDEKSIIVEHSKAIKFLLFLFLGFVIGFALIYILLPDNMVHSLFGVQLNTIENINSNVISGRITAMDAFVLILINNLKVLFFCLIFAFFFGAGSIFVLAWNASVISAAVGTYFSNGLVKYSLDSAMSNLFLSFQLFIAGIMRYMIHGVFEIGGYFAGALAGGIISMALVNHGIKSKGFKRIAIDVSLLVLVGIGLLVIGTIIEVFVTPALF